MDGTRPREPLTDSALEREIETALGIEPSPEFLARVRTRVAAEPEVSSWRLAIRGLAVEPLWGVAIVGIVLAVVVPELMREHRAVPPQSSAIRLSPKPATLVEPGPRIEAARAVRDVASTHRAAMVRGGGTEPPTLPLRLSPVLFSEDERAVLAALVMAVSEGRMDPVPADVAAVSKSEDSIVLAIEPLVIDPLPSLARVETQGADQW